jgi:biotin carboxylase/SAM-dependent methyltransferase
MGHMKTAKETIIVVDGYSTGADYLPLLLARGIVPVHVRATSPSLESGYTDCANHYLERWEHGGAILMDGTRDFDALCRVLFEYHPMAVLAGCEGGVELVDRLACRLGLPGNDPSLGEACRDKSLMHQMLARSGIRSLYGLLVDNFENLRTWVNSRDVFPVVLKPPKSAGADGVHICRSMEEVEDAFQKLINTPSFFGDPITHVLAQEFAPGSEVVVNTVSREGRHMVSELLRYSKTITAEGRSIYDGAMLVTDFEEATENVLDYAFAVLDALGIRFGPAHMEIMITASGPVLIECGARPMGASFPQDLLKECIGRTQLELSLASYIDPDFFSRWREIPYKLNKHFMIKCLVSDREGDLDATPGVTLLTSLPSVKRGNFMACLEAGHVQRTVDLLSAPAHLYLCHEDAAVVKKDYQLIREMEKHAWNLLFELSPKHPEPMNREWFRLIPDEQWLKSEEEAVADADSIWRALALASGMDVLDCPCGDGRVSMHLAKRGVRITGIDINPRFIENARERFMAEGLDGDFSIRDMRELVFENRFDAVINWFNSFGYFDIETDFDVLKRLCRALRSGGHLLIEAPNRGDILANTRPKTAPNGREFVRQWDEISERMFVSITGKGKEGSAPVVVAPRLYSQVQYRLLFRLVGLELISVFNENISDFNENSRRMIMVARKF